MEIEEVFIHYAISRKEKFSQISGEVRLASCGWAESEEAFQESDLLAE